MKKNTLDHCKKAELINIILEQYAIIDKLNKRSDPEVANWIDTESGKCCSRCYFGFSGLDIYYHHFDYCPHCGAKMEV